MAKASDFGRNDRTFFVRTHLGHLLHPGDHALGYDMSTANTADPGLEAATNAGLTVPDVILVRLSSCGSWLPLLFRQGRHLSGTCCAWAGRAHHRPQCLCLCSTSLATPCCQSGVKN